MNWAVYRAILWRASYGTASHPWAGGVRGESSLLPGALEVAAARKKPCSSQEISGVPASSVPGQRVMEKAALVCPPRLAYLAGVVAGRPQGVCAASCEAALLHFCL